VAAVQVTPPSKERQARAPFTPTATQVPAPSVATPYTVPFGGVVAAVQVVPPSMERHAKALPVPTATQVPAPSVATE